MSESSKATPPTPPQNTTSPNVKSKEDATLDACLRLLAGSKDESVLAGLLLVAKHVSTTHFSRNRERIFGAMKGRTFLTRLLCGAKVSDKDKNEETESNNTEAFRAISLSVSAFFCGDSALAARSFRDFVPLWLGLLADLLTSTSSKSSTNGTPQARSIAMVEDLLICLHGVIAGDSHIAGRHRNDPRASSCAEACVDHNAGSLLVQLACNTVGSFVEDNEGDNVMAMQDKLTEFDVKLGRTGTANALEWPTATRIHALQVLMLLHHQAPTSSIRRLTPIDGAMLAGWLAMNARTSKEKSSTSTINMKSDTSNAMETITIQESDVVGVANLLGVLLGRDRILSRHLNNQQPFLQQTDHDRATFAAFQKFTATTTAQLLLQPTLTDEFRAAAWVLASALCEHCGQAWARFSCVQSLMRRRIEPDTSAAAAAAATTTTNTEATKEDAGKSSNATKTNQQPNATVAQEERSFVSVLMRLVAVEITVRLSDTRFICLQSSLMPEDRRQFKSTSTEEDNTTTTTATTFGRAMAVTPLCFSVLRHAIRFLTTEPTSEQQKQQQSSSRWDTLPWASLKHVQSAIDEAVSSFAEFAEVTRDVMDVMASKSNRSRAAITDENNKFSVEDLHGVRLLRFRRMCVAGSNVLLTWLKENAGSDDSSILRIQQRRTRDLIFDVLPWMVSLEPIQDGSPSDTKSTPLACEWDLVIPALLSSIETEDETEDEHSATICSALLARSDAVARLADGMMMYVQQVTTALDVKRGSSAAAFSADKLVAFAFRAIDVGKVLLVLSLNQKDGCDVVAKATEQANAPLATDRLCVCLKALVETHLESNSTTENRFPVAGLDSQLTKKSVCGIVGHLLALSLWLSFGCALSSSSSCSAVSHQDSNASFALGFTRSCDAGLDVLRRLCARITKRDYAEVVEVKDELMPLIEMCKQRHYS